MKAASRFLSAASAVALSAGLVTSATVGTYFASVVAASAAVVSRIDVRGNQRVDAETIRQALAIDYLPSSCFMVERELDDTGTPISFTFVGAGQGHGVGMCKTGAAIMAVEGYKSNDILKHYFESADIQSIYERNLT